MVLSAPSRVISSATTEPELVWTHPTLSISEQRIAKAECQMQTFEGSPHPMYVRTYMDACLTSRGFMQTPESE